MKIINHYGYENVKIYMDNTFECGHLLEKRILDSTTKQNLIDDFKKGYNVFGLPIDKTIREIEDVDFLKDNPLIDNPLIKGE